MAFHTLPLDHYYQIITKITRQWKSTLTLDSPKMKLVGAGLQKNTSSLFASHNITKEFSLRDRRLKGNRKGIAGAQEARKSGAVSRPNSLPLPFRTLATQATNTTARAHSLLHNSTFAICFVLLSTELFLRNPHLYQKLIVRLLILKAKELENSCQMAC